MQRSKGFFITFEGGEGSGKSTQVNRLAASLQASGYAVVVTREPGGTPEAEKIRNLLVQSDGGNWNAMEECLLLFAARLNHYRTLIEPALNEKKIVICDRFSDSTRAYQGYGLGLPLEHIEAIKFLTLGSVEPDLTLLLDIPVKEGLARSTKRLQAENSGEDRYEGMELDFHEKLRQGFLSLSRSAPQRFCVMNASRCKDDLSEEIASYVNKRLGK
jgi:dTMP kinase